VGLLGLGFLLTDSNVMSNDLHGVGGIVYEVRLWLKCRYRAIKRLI
jgi:hypothetical protein